MRKHLELLGWRPLAASLLGLVLLPALAGVSLVGPRAPWALHRADSLAISGYTERAIRAYESIGLYSFSDEDRAEALYRGGVFAAAEGGQPERAVALFTRLAKDFPDHPRTPEALARMGSLLGDELGELNRGVRAYVQAAALAPAHPDAPGWLLEAASLSELSGARNEAWNLRKRVAKLYEDYAPRANMALARMTLRSGDAATARELYEGVLADPRSTPEDRELARLGLSFSLEELGEVEAAVAELDPDNPDFANRRERVLERHEARTR